MRDVYGEGRQHGDPGEGSGSSSGSECSSRKVSPRKVFTAFLMKKAFSTTRTYIACGKADLVRISARKPIDISRGPKQGKTVLESHVQSRFS